MIIRKRKKVNKKRKEVLGTHFVLMFDEISNIYSPEAQKKKINKELFRRIMMQLIIFN